MCNRSTDISGRGSSVSCPLERIKYSGLTAEGIAALPGVCAFGIVPCSDLAKVVRDTGRTACRSDHNDIRSVVERGYLLDNSGVTSVAVDYSL